MGKHLKDQTGKKESKIDFTFNAQAYTLIIALVLIAILFATLTGGEFLSSRNLSNLFTQMAVISVLAIGMTFVIVAAHIDLSVGSLAEIGRASCRERVKRRVLGVSMKK